MKRPPEYFLEMARRYDQRARDVVKAAASTARHYKRKAEENRKQARALAPAGSPPSPGLPGSKK